MGYDSAWLIMSPPASESAALRKTVGELRSAGVDVVTRVTWEEGHAETFAAHASSAGAGAIIAAGGDGTLNEVVTGAWESGGPPCAVGVLPFGTANDFAAGFGIDVHNPERGLEFFPDLPAVEIDVGIVSDRPFVNMASAGFGARVTTETSPGLKRVFGGAAYFLKGVSDSLGMRADTMRLRGPDLEWEGSAHLVCLGNGPQTGGGWKVCPEAELDDGLLDLLVVPEAPTRDLAGLLQELVFRGEHSFESETVVYRQLPWVELESDEDLQVNLDGEPLFGTSFRFEVVEKALSLLDTSF